MYLNLKFKYLNLLNKYFEINYYYLMHNEVLTV